MKINYFYILFIALGTLSSCKQDAATTNVSTDTYTAAKKAVDESPSVATARVYLDEIKKKLKAEGGKDKTLLLEGQQVAERFKMGPTAISFLMPLVKNYSDDPNAGDWTAKLASALSDVKREKASSILAAAYLQSYPEGKFVKSLKSKLGDNFESPNKTLESLAKQVFENPDKYGINRTNAQRYVDACEAYALGFPKADDAPEYLYKGAEMARTLRTFNKALSIYDWIAEAYPNYSKTPTTLFLKGFMLENELNDKAKAKETYHDFLAKYKDHELTDDIEFLLENIDKSDEEIMQMIEKKKK